MEKLLRLEATFVVSTEYFAQCIFHGSTILEPVAGVLSFVVEKEPKFETRITDCGVHALPSSFAERLSEIRGVWTGTSMIYVNEQPPFVIFCVFKGEQPLEHVRGR
jgi:hypothetical protein